MQQSHDFDSRLRQLKEGDPTAQTLPHKTTYHSDVTVNKKFCFLWEDGTIRGFHYRDFVDVHCTTAGDVLTLKMIDNTIILKGFNLHLLAMRFLLDEPYMIAVTSERYTVLNRLEKFIVFEIIIQK